MRAPKPAGPNGSQPSRLSPAKPSGSASRYWPRTARKPAPSSAAAPPPAFSAAHRAGGYRLWQRHATPTARARAPTRRGRVEHVYLSCWSSLTAAGCRRADRSAKRAHAAGCIGGGRPQQLAKLMGRAEIEAAIGAMGEPRDFPKGPLGDRVVAFLEHEGGHAEQARARRPTRTRSSIASSIASPTKTKACTFAFWLSRAGMRQDLSDLGVAAAAIDPFHQARPIVRLAKPSATRGIRRARGNRRAARRDRRSKRPRGTCRPAAGRPCPRSAAGSSWRRGRRSAGRVCPARWSGQACARAREKPQHRSKRRRPVGAGARSDRSFVIAGRPSANRRLKVAMRGRRRNGAIRRTRLGGLRRGG